MHVMSRNPFGAAVDISAADILFLKTKIIYYM